MSKHMSPETEALLDDYIIQSQDKKPLSDTVQRDLRHALKWAAMNADTWPGNEFIAMFQHAAPPNAVERSFGQHFRSFYPGFFKERELSLDMAEVLDHAQRFLMLHDLTAAMLRPPEETPKPANDPVPEGRPAPLQLAPDRLAC